MSVLNANHLSCAYKKTLEFDLFLTGIKLFNYKLLVGGQAKLDISALFFPTKYTVFNNI